MARKLSNLEYSLLALIAAAPASGYALRTVFQTTLLDIYSDSPGSVYPALRRLARDGLIVGRSEKGSRRREIFSLTSVGHAAVHDWLRSPIVARDITGANHLTTMLRLAFLSDVAPDHLTAFCREYIDALHAHIAVARRALDDGSKLSESSVLAIELGLADLQARETRMRQLVPALARPRAPGR